MKEELEKLEQLLKGATVTYKGTWDNTYHSFLIDKEAERLKRNPYPFLGMAEGNIRVAVLYWNGLFEVGEWYITLAPEVKAHLNRL